MTIEEFKTLSSCYNVPSISVDFYKDGYSCLSSKQLDNARCVVISLTENGIFKEMWADGIARIRMKKPDDTYIYNDCENIDDGRILCRFSEQMLATSGKSCADIQITRENGDIYSTKLFYINITALPYDSHTIESSDEFDALNKLVEDESQRIETVKQLENTITANETIRNENESVRETNEGHRITAEVSRETDTNTAVSNANTATLNANQATDNAYSATEAAAEATTNANTSTQKANDTIEIMKSLIADDNIMHTDKLGAPNGVATLDEEGYLSKSQIPDRTVEIIYGTLTENGEFVDIEGNTITGGINKQYIDTNVGIPYIWSGIEYVATGSKLGLGFTSSSAFPGDRGLELENRTTTLEEFHNNLSAEKVKYNGSDTSLLSANVQDAITELSSVATTSKKGLMSVSDKLKVDNYANIKEIALVLSAARWIGDNAPYTQTVTLENIGTYNNCSVSIDSNADALQETQLINAQIYEITYDELSGMTFTANGEKPTVDIPILFEIGTSMNCIEKPVYLAGTNSASEVSYNNIYSGLTETNVQDALDTTIASSNTNTNAINTHKASNDHDGRYYTETEVNNLLADKAPLNHTSTATTYGAGTGSAYGHVKLSDVYASAVATANSSLGASQYSVYSAYNQLNTSKLPLSGGTLTGALTMANGKYIKSLNTPGTDINLIGINNINNIHMGAYFGSGDTDPEDIPVYLHARGIKYTFQDSYFGPGTDNKIKLGSSGNVWSTVYAKTGTINTSDRTKKHHIKNLTALHEQLFLRLSPKSFVFNDGDRVHIGAISQDVEDSMLELGITAEQFAGFCKDIRYEYTEFNDVDGEPIESSKVPVRNTDGNIVYDYSLRYQEFIFLTIHMVQKLYDRVDNLEKKLLEKDAQVGNLENRLSSIEEKLCSN